MNVFKPSGRSIYRIKFRDQNDIERTISSGMRDRRAAEGFYSLLVKDVERLKAGYPLASPELTAEILGIVTPGRTTWKHFRERFEAEYLTHLRERSREKTLTVLNVFEEECDPKSLKAINEAMLSNFKARLAERPIVRRGKKTDKIGFQPWTIKNYLIALKTALVWAVEQKLITTVPTFPQVKVPKLKPQPIREDDWKALVKAAPDERWRAYLLCGWFGGLRLSEALHLRYSRSEEWPWLDLVADRIWLPARFVKADTDQWIPLHPELRAALEALPVLGDLVFPFPSKKTGEQLSRSGVSNNVIYFARKAGVKLSMHRLRKGFGCRVAQQLGKGDAPVLHRLMRHSSMQVTMDYYASVDDVLAAKIRELDKPSEARPPADPAPPPETKTEG